MIRERESIYRSESASHIINLSKAKAPTLKMKKKREKAAKPFAVPPQSCKSATRAAL